MAQKFPPRHNLGRPWISLALPSLLLVISIVALQLRPSNHLCNILSVSLALAVSVNIAIGYQLWGSQFDLVWILFNLGILFWYALPGLMRLLNGVDWVESGALLTLGPEDFARSFAVTALFLFLFQLGYLVRLPKNISLLIDNYVLPRAPFRFARSPILLGTVLILTVAFYVGLSGGVGAALSNLLSGRSIVKPWTADGNYGTSLTPFHNLTTTIRVLLAILSGYLFIHERTSTFRRVFFASLWVVASATVAMDSGTRSQLLLCVVPPIILFIRSYRRRGRTAGLTLAPAIVPIIALLLFTSSFMRSARSSGDLDEALSDATLVIQDTDGLAHTAFALREMTLEPPTHESVLLNILAGPIPRVLLQDKPDLESVVIHSYYIWGIDIRERGGNTLPYITGQYLIAWGWLGLVEVGLTLGIICWVVDQTLMRRSDVYAKLFAATFATYIFVAFRLISFGYSFQLTLLLFLIHLERLASRKWPARGPQV
ncbi:MAG: hypothetical protein OZ928_18645 [Polyangiaceae bacterium]|nr:hypothetical protein [Polyangiaceae bacterium]